MQPQEQLESLIHDEKGVCTIHTLDSDVLLSNRITQQSLSFIEARSLPANTPILMKRTWRDGSSKIYKGLLSYFSEFNVLRINVEVAALGNDWALTLGEDMDKDSVEIYLDPEPLSSEQYSYSLAPGVERE